MTWNVDDVLRFISIHGAEVGVDNDGQIVLYTGLTEDGDGNLIDMSEVFDA